MIIELPIYSTMMLYLEVENNRVIKSEVSVFRDRGLVDMCESIMLYNKIKDTDAYKALVDEYSNERQINEESIEFIKNVYGGRAMKEVVFRVVGVDNSNFIGLIFEVNGGKICNIISVVLEENDLDEANTVLRAQACYVIGDYVEVKPSVEMVDFILDVDLAVSSQLDDFNPQDRESIDVCTENLDMELSNLLTMSDCGVDAIGYIKHNYPTLMREDNLEKSDKEHLKKLVSYLSCGRTVLDFIKDNYGVRLSNLLAVLDDTDDAIYNNLVLQDGARLESIFEESMQPVNMFKRSV